MIKDITYDIIDFLEDIDDITNDIVDKMEVEPVRLSSNIYVTGIKRAIDSYTDVELHLKQIRTIKLTSNNKSITDDDGLWMMEPDGEMWVNTQLLDEKVVESAFNKIKDNFNKMKSFFLMRVTYREKGSAINHVETLLYKNKKVACKEAIRMKKKYEEVHVKFETFSGANGEYNTVHEPTDFEIAAAAAE